MSNDINEPQFVGHFDIWAVYFWTVIQQTNQKVKLCSGFASLVDTFSISDITSRNTFAWLLLCGVVLMLYYNLGSCLFFILFWCYTSNYEINKATQDKTSKFTKCHLTRERRNQAKQMYLPTMGKACNLNLISRVITQRGNRIKPLENLKEPVTGWYYKKKVCVKNMWNVIRDLLTLLVILAGKTETWTLWNYYVPHAIGGSMSHVLGTSWGNWFLSWLTICLFAKTVHRPVWKLLRRIKHVSSINN